MGFFDNIRNMPPITKNLIIINLIIWLAMNAVPSINAMLVKYGALYYVTSDTFIPSQLISYMFIHANFTHLFFNMFALFMFGITMERVLGGTKFLFYYISCGLGAALVQEGVFAIMISHYASIFENGDSLVALLQNSNVYFHELHNIGISPEEPHVMTLYSLMHSPTVGASGSIFGILLAFGFMFPNATIYMIIPPMPIKARVFVMLYAALELALGVYNNQADTVAHFAHLGGMLFGLLILLYWRKNRIIGGPYI